MDSAESSSGFLFHTCLTILFPHCTIAFPSTFPLGAYLATRTCRAADILHMWSDRGTRLILLVCSQTQLAVHCEQQETWRGLAGARLGGKLTLGGKRLEAAAQVSLHMLAVSGQAQLPGPLLGESSTSVPVLEAGETRRVRKRADAWHRAQPICSLFTAALLNVLQS